jgi:hypothetical protein
MYSTKNYWFFFGLFQSSSVFESINTTFRKLHLFPSSGKGGEDTDAVGPPRKSYSKSSDDGNRSSFRNVVFLLWIKPDDGKSKKKNSNSMCLFECFCTWHSMFWPILVIIRRLKFLAKTTVIQFCGSRCLIPSTRLCVCNMHWYLMLLFPCLMCVDVPDYVQKADGLFFPPDVEKSVNLLDESLVTAYNCRNI